MDDNPLYDTMGGPLATAFAPSRRDLASARSITVNGRRHLVRTEEIDDGQLVRLAFPEAAESGGSGSSLTVTYRGGPYGAAECPAGSTWTSTS